MLLVLLVSGGCPSGLQPEAICLGPVQGAAYAGGPLVVHLISLYPHCSVVLAVLMWCM